MRELSLQSTSHHRKRFTQSDTALLPSNVYFQRTLSPVSVPSKTASRTGRRRGSKVRCLIFPHACLLNSVTFFFCTRTPAVYLKSTQSVVAVKYIHVVQLIGTFAAVPLGGRNEQDSGPGYRSRTHYEEDHRPDGQETVS